MNTMDPRDVQPVIDQLRARGLTILEVVQARDSLEDLFMDSVTDASTGRAPRPGAASPASPPPPPPPIDGESETGSGPS